MRRFRPFAAALLALAFVAGASAATYSSNTAIPILDAPIGQFPPPPGVTIRTLDVSETSTISSVTVVLMGIQHAESEDLDIAVISPAGTKVVLMSDAGKSASTRPDGPAPFDPIAAGTILTFSDSGGVLPAMGPIPTGTYHPANYGPNTTDPLCQGESDQDPPFTTTLSSFSGQQANGTWTLNIHDDCGGGDGQIAGGWCVIINSSSRPCDSPPTAVSVSIFTARRAGGSVQLEWQTGTETALAGFNLLRTGAGSTVKVNRVLVRAAGGSGGSSYRLADRTAKPGLSYVYRLQAVYTDATRARVATARLG